LKKRQKKSNDCMGREKKVWDVRMVREDGVCSVARCLGKSLQLIDSLMFKLTERVGVAWLGLLRVGFWERKGLQFFLLRRRRRDTPKSDTLT